MATRTEQVAKGKIYALQSKHVHRNRRGGKYRTYYTGRKPAENITRAKLFDLRTAKGVRDFATTGSFYRIIKVPPKVLFVMSLKGL